MSLRKSIISFLDKSTRATTTIDHSHHEIHDGSHYYYADYALNQAVSTEIEFIFVTPDTSKWAHLLFSASSSDGITVELYEGSTGIVGGTSITPRNNNRNSTNTSVITLTKDPVSIAGDGTRAAGFVAGGTRTAGNVERESEFLLKQNETYLVRITSLANANDISWDAEWYEHTDAEKI